jgi:hypothetical protein
MTQHADISSTRDHQLLGRRHPGAFGPRAESRISRAIKLDDEIDSVLPRPSKKFQFP